MSNELILSNQQKIEAVELTAEEVAEALTERKKRKFFHEKHSEYWEKLESKKGKAKVTEMKI